MNPLGQAYPLEQLGKFLHTSWRAGTASFTRSPTGHFLPHSVWTRHSPDAAALLIPLPPPPPATEWPCSGQPQYRQTLPFLCLCPAQPLPSSFHCHPPSGPGEQMALLPWEKWFCLFLHPIEFPWLSSWKKKSSRAFAPALCRWETRPERLATPLAHNQSISKSFQLYYYFFFFK